MQMEDLLLLDAEMEISIEVKLEENSKRSLNVTMKENCGDWQ